MALRAAGTATCISPASRPQATSRATWKAHCAAATGAPRRSCLADSDEMRLSTDPGQVSLGFNYFVAMLKRTDGGHVLNWLRVHAAAVEDNVLGWPGLLALGTAFLVTHQVDHDDTAHLTGRAVGVPDVVLPLAASGAVHPVLLPRWSEVCHRDRLYSRI